MTPAWTTPPAAAAARPAAQSPGRQAHATSGSSPSNGRRLLRFTSILINLGAGPMEVLGRRPNTSSPWTVRQVIDNDAGGERRVDTDATLRYAGDGHNHWHVEQMMVYHLWSSRATRADRKVGLLLLRHDPVGPEPAALAEQRRTTANRGAADGRRSTSRTGISVGWADTYRCNLAYQWIDITGLPGGTYTVRAMSDPHDWFLETNETDGCGWTKVKFGSSGTSVSVVSSGRGCITDWSSIDVQAAHRLGVRERHHRRLRPRHVLPREPGHPAPDGDVHRPGDRAAAAADRPGLLRRRRRR